VGKIKIGGIMQSEGRAILRVMSVPERPDVAGIILKALGSQGINIEFLVESFDLDGYGNFTLCIDQRDLDSALAILDQVKQAIDAKAISYDPDVGVVSVFGPHFREKPMVSGIMFSALGDAGITPLAISTSISSVSCIVKAYEIDMAVKVLEDAFESPFGVKERAKEY